MEQFKQNWHNLSIEATFWQLKTTRKGISDEEAKQRLKKFGFNKLPEEKRLTGIRIFLNQFKSPLIYILVIAGFITLILNHWTDSMVIFAAVFLNAGVGFFQENKASKIFDKLKTLIREKALVIREGHKKEINQVYLVPGDIIVLYPGDKVPADARIVEAFDLKVNEAVLTGEWLASEKSRKALPEKTPLADRENIVYMGTIVEDGKAEVVVVSTGTNTEIGEIAISIREAKEGRTPYQKKLAHFSKIIAFVIGFICLGIFIGGTLTGKDIVEMLITAIAVAVAAIPEGLPVAMTVILALGMERISKKKGLVRKLIATETLGSTQIICTDKTGTLTEAKMQIAGVFTGTKELLSNGRRYSENINKNGIESHILALKIAALCNEAFVENPKETMEDWIIRGRPTEKALLLAAIQAGIIKEEIENEYPRIDDLSFDPVYKYSASVHRLDANQEVIYILGAPEIILNNSKYLECDGTEELLSPKKVEELTKKYEDLDRKGLRVLAAGYKKINKDILTSRIKKALDSKQSISKTEKENIYAREFKDMVFVGFIALKDPLRKDVKEAIRICKKAGMKPIIITGDHRLTAKAIAEELGFQIKEKNIIEGKELDAMSDEDFKKRLDNFEIYARVEPKQKLRIVSAWQEKGKVVAMTGDGVNDAPALKQADIGVALGSGTDVAKEASDLIILTDDFSIIVAAVEEGRAIMDNIRKVIVYLFSDAFTEIIIIGLSVFAKLPLPLLPAQILWVNLVEDSLPAVSLAFESKEKDVMDRKPEDLRASLLTREMRILIFVIGIITDLMLLGLFIWLLKRNLPLAEIRTIMFAALGIDSVFYIFSCKNLHKNIWNINIFSNLFLIGSWFLAIFMLLIGVYVPAFQKLLRTIPLNFSDWLLVLALGVINLVLIEFTKWIFTLHHSRRKSFKIDSAKAKPTSSSRVNKYSDSK